MKSTLTPAPDGRGSWCRLFNVVSEPPSRADAMNTSQLRERRNRLAEEFAELQWDLGGMELARDLDQEAVGAPPAGASA